jgi:hypothetical protein
MLALELNPMSEDIIRKVRELKHRLKPAGTVRILWDGSAGSYVTFT